MGSIKLESRTVNGITFTVSMIEDAEGRTLTLQAITMADWSRVDTAIAELESEGFVVGYDYTYTIWGSRREKL